MGIYSKRDGGGGGVLRYLSHIVKFCPQVCVFSTDLISSEKGHKF